MSLKKGERIRHSIKAEWGLGEVLADSDGEKVRTNEKVALKEGFDFPASQQVFAKSFMWCIAPGKL